MKPVLLAFSLAAVGMMSTSCAPDRPARSTHYYHTGSTPTQSGPDQPEKGGAGWPVLVVSGGTTFSVYEPTVDFWDGHQLVARDAVAVQSADQGQPVYGVVTLKALTVADKSSRTVALEQLQVSEGDFPSAREHTQEYVQLLRKQLPERFPKLSLDQVQASLTPPPAQSEPLNNTPPQIIVSTRPALLVLFDGPPAFRPVAQTDLQRAINTRVLLLKDSHEQLFLHLWDGYLTAPNLNGPWSAATSLPAGVQAAETQARTSAATIDLLQAQPDAQTGKTASLTNTPLPVVYTRTSPTEMITFEGEPNFVPIPNTKLLYAANTSGNVFKLLSDQQTYVLLAGRWYRSPSLKGPWEFVTPTRLAVDFADIPDNSPKENVKASVPGTRQANEALIANSIPQDTKVARNAQMEDPHVDGEPRLAAITGTPLSYVVNSATPIIEVDPNSWYACQNGVWYASTSVKGPWVAADSVPAVIYSIPPSSPLHYLTYVRVYGTSPEYVYEGYTPGYLGTEVQYGVVVYGTGYYYDPWIGSYWYGYPATWGFGWGPCWTPWDGWCFSFGFGWGPYWAWGPPYPCWGPYYHYHNHYHDGLVAWRGGHWSTGHDVYRSSSGFTATRTGATRPLSSNRYGQAYNSRTGTLAAGQHAPVQNVFRDQRGASAAGAAWRGSATAGNPTHGSRSAGAGSAAYGAPGRSYGASPPLVPPGGSYGGYYGARGGAEGSRGAIPGYGSRGPAGGGSRAAAPSGGGWSGGGSRGGGWSGHSGGGGGRDR